MSRRRYISTAISIDSTINQLALEAGDFAALLYTWMIPHAEDSATITAQPDELLYMVAPARRDKTEADVEAALRHMDSLGLVAWKPDEGVIYFDTSTFYRYQAYIPAVKRADHSALFAKNGDNNKKAPKVALSAPRARGASLSPSPSPSKNISSPAPADDGFSDFWNPYPRKVGKAETKKRWKRLGVQDRAAAILAVVHLAAYANEPGTDLQYVSHPATFIGPKRAWEDWKDGKPPGYGGGNGKGPALVKRPTCPKCEADLTYDDRQRAKCPMCDYREVPA